MVLHGMAVQIGQAVNRLMRVSIVTFVLSLAVWALIAVWTIIDVSELLVTWQRIAAVLAVASGLTMLAILVYRAWERLGR
jgi:hypothetical protein